MEPDETPSGLQANLLGEVAMGLGLALGYGAAGAQEGLDMLLARREAAKKMAMAEQQQTLNEQFRRDTLSQQEAQRQAALQQAAEIAKQNDDTRRLQILGMIEARDRDEQGRNERATEAIRSREEQAAANRDIRAALGAGNLDLRRLALALAGQRFQAGQTYSFKETDPKTGKDFTRWVRIRPDNTAEVVGGEGGESGAVGQGTMPQSMKDRIMWAEKAKPIVARIRALSLGTEGTKGLNADSGALQVIKGTGRSLMGPLSTKQSVYNDLIPSASMLATRVMGSNSQLSDGERQALAGTWPKPTDSNDIARLKIAAWDDIFNKTGDEQAQAAAARNFLDTLYQVENKTGPSVVASPNTPSPQQSSGGPSVGERRMINGRMGEWNGKGWVPVK